MSLEDFKPVVEKHIFSKDQYEDIYKRVNKTFPEVLEKDVPEGSKYINAGDIGYFAYIGGFRDDIYDRVQELGKKYYRSVGKPEIHFARYSLKTGYPPILRPHYDEMLKYPSITLSIQLEKTFDWDLYANNTGEMLSENEGLVFSGSHQIHWRPRVGFKDDDYYDIMVCQMRVSDEELSEDHFDKMFALKLSTLENFFVKYPENVNSLPKTVNLKQMFAN
jgi:hypothetical protein